MYDCIHHYGLAVYTTKMNDTLTVLIIEDDTNIRDMYSDAFTGAGLTVYKL